MTPSVDRFLQVAIVHLMTRTSQALGPGFEQSNTLVLSGMLTAVQQEFERGAARRVEENGALRALFAGAAPVVTEGALQERLSIAAGQSEGSLAISALEKENAELRALLIELHEHVEGLQSPEARDIEADVWKELVASTERRRLAIGRF